MRKKHLFSCIALLVAFTMLLGGCAGKTQEEASNPAVESEESTEASTEEQKEEAKETVTFEIYGGIAGSYENLWWTEMLEEDLGVKVQCLGTDAELLDTYIAAGDLPDILRIDSLETQQLAYEAGLLVNLDDYKELLPNLYERYPEGSLQFQRDKYEDGGLYTIPSGAGTDAKTYGSDEYAMRVDFPYYLEYCEANGEPELKDIEDFIPILKWIQEQHPTNEEGQPSYGISIFAEWDGSTMGYAEWIAEQYGVRQFGFNEVNMDTLERKSMFDDDSYYKRAIKFLYEANQAGILDPDSMTQTYDDLCAKNKARRVYTRLCFDTNEYHKLIPYENLHSTNYAAAPQLGNSSGVWSICISSSCENIERACEFLNYCMDEENWWELVNGPQGEYWDVNEEGLPYVTEFGKEMAADPNVQFSTGGNINDADSIETWNWRFLPRDYVYSQYGVVAEADAWPTASDEGKTESQKLWEEWLVDVRGFEHPGGVVSELQVVNALASHAEARNGSTGVTMSDELKELRSRLNAVVPTMCWQMVYASSEAEFESIWDSMVEQVTEMGVAEYSDWYYEDYVAGVEGYEAYCY